jgi:4-hydroxymandelate oxidase
MEETYKNAAILMKGYCRVCKVCDGRACAGEVPGMGGLGTATSFKNNLKALADIQFNMRLVHDVTDPDTRVTILGKELSMPVLAAPIGGVSFNMGGKVSEEKYLKSVIFGCLEKGIMGCTGDGVPDFIHQTAFDILAEAKGQGIPFIKPWEDKELSEKLEKAAATGVDIIGMDIDAAGLVTLKKMGRPVSPKTVSQLRDIIEKVPAKFILKGIMTVDDAKAAVDAGADAVVVSNHGGRVLDFTPGAATVLPGICEAVKGQITILADGGIRSGADVLKLLALGADAVMIGRPFSVAAIGGLQQGVVQYIEKIQTELAAAMVLTGVQNAKDVPKGIVY